MKKIILIISISLLYALNITAQNDLPYKSLEDFKNDTSAFVMYNFMDRGLSYQGKTFADVVKDLEIPIKNFAYNYSNDDMIYAMDISVRSDMSFKKDEDYNSIFIEWENILNKNLQFDLDKAKYGWNNDVYNFYKNWKIKRVYVDIPEESKYYSQYGVLTKSVEKKKKSGIVKAFMKNGLYTLRIIKN